MVKDDSRIRGSRRIHGHKKTITGGWGEKHEGFII